MKSLRVQILFTIWVVGMTALRLAAAAIPLELDLAQSNHVDAKALADGGYAITTTGEDPFVMSKPLAVAYDAERQYVLSFEYFCAEGLDSVELFYGPPIRGGQSASGPELLSSEGWTTYALNIKTCQEPGSWRGGFTQFRFDFGRTGGRTIQLRKIELRAPTEDEQKMALQSDDRKTRVAAFDAEVRARVEAEHAVQIERVEATGKTLQISIKTGAKDKDLVLCEIPLYQSPVGRQDFVWQKPLSPHDGTQTIEFERLRGMHDRVFSSWVVMRNTPTGFEPASHQRFVEQLPSQWTLKRDRPKSKKGTAGMHGGDAFQCADYKAMGIHNATMNIVLPALVAKESTENTVPHEFNGTTVHIQRGPLEQLDRSMREMNELDIVVSAIILIPKKTPMSHPDCAPEGIYAMANVVEEDGWNIYAAGLDFLAQRYLRPDREYGRITHWILHNEVDAGWIWTNAGELPLHTYLDLHYRSMRTAQSVIRRYGDAGDVLLSLTHYWTKSHNSRCYAPKDMIDLLAKRSLQEGDFDWGLAFHPYPQNLRDPRTWMDREATADFQTRHITPKNLEVLDAYMRQIHMLHSGEVRTIVLSEQGLNSPDHTEESYRNQAAGLVYTWLKLGRLDSIESFVHHQWMDHPQEGGLNLGLRRRPESSDAAAQAATVNVCAEFARFGLECAPDETSKPAREIYRILETPAQGQAVEWAKTVISEENFPAVPATVNRP